MAIVVKRVYAVPAKSDGTRVLVDRLWPRGMTKAAAALDAWLKELAPSDELRHWLHQRPGSLDCLPKEVSQGTGPARSI